MMSDLQLLELGCSRKKTLWERHQLVIIEKPVRPQIWAHITQTKKDQVDRNWKCLESLFQCTVIFILQKLRSLLVSPRYLLQMLWFPWVTFLWCQTYSAWSWVVAEKRPSGSSVNWLCASTLQYPKWDYEVITHTIRLTEKPFHFWKWPYTLYCNVLSLV